MIDGPNEGFYPDANQLRHRASMEALGARSRAVGEILADRCPECGADLVDVTDMTVNGERMASSGRCPADRRHGEFSVDVRDGGLCYSQSVTLDR